MINLELSNKIKLISLLSIVMVIYIHNYNIKEGMVYFFDIDSSLAFINIFIQNLFSEGFSRTAVPIFFLISSYLFFQKFTLNGYPRKIFKRIRTLFLPYLFWTTVVVLIHFTLQSIPSLTHFFNKRLIVDLSFWELFVRTWIDPLNYPLWFLRDLIVLTILTPFVYYFLKYLPKMTLVVMLILWFLDTSLYIIDHDSLLFFTIGAYIALFQEEFISIKISNKKFIFVLISYLCLAFFKAYLLTENGSLETVFTMVLFQKSLILMGIIVLWFLLDRVKMLSLLFFTQFTFLFYVFHEPTLTILEKGILALFGRSPFVSFISYLFLPVFILMGLTFFGLFLKKYFPRFIAVVTGYRV